MTKIEAATDAVVKFYRDAAESVLQNEMALPGELRNQVFIANAHTRLELIARIDSDRAEIAAQNTEIERLNTLGNRFQQDYLDEANKLDHARKDIATLKGEVERLRGLCLSVELGDECRSMAGEVLECDYHPPQGNDYRLRRSTYEKLCHLLDRVGNVNNSAILRQSGGDNEG